MSRDDWPAKDEHLQAALRHAPDRDLQPPAALSARILDEARRKVAPAPWPARWLDWMLKPAGAAAFGSVLLAGVIGLMWRGEVPPSTAETEGYAEPATIKSQQPASSPSDAALGQLRSSREPTAARAEQSAPAAPSTSASIAKRRAPEVAALQRLDASRERAEANDAPAKPAAPAAQAKDAAGSRLRAARSEAIVSPPAPAARALPTDPLEGAIATLRKAGTSAPALERWTQLQAAARGRWQLQNERERPRGSEVRTPQGALLGWLAVESSQVRWQAVDDESVWQVEVPAALAERLRAALFP